MAQEALFVIIEMKEVQLLQISLSVWARDAGGGEEGTLFGNSMLWKCRACRRATQRVFSLCPLAQSRPQSSTAVRGAFVRMCARVGASRVSLRVIWACELPPPSY